MRFIVYPLIGLIILMNSIPVLSLSVSGTMNLQGEALAFLKFSGIDISYNNNLVGSNYAFKNLIDGQGQFSGDQMIDSKSDALRFDQAILGAGDLVVNQNLFQSFGPIESTANTDFSVSDGLSSTSQSVVVGKGSGAASCGLATIANYADFSTNNYATTNGDPVYQSMKSLGFGVSDPNSPMLATITSAYTLNADPFMGQSSMSVLGDGASRAKYISADIFPGLGNYETINWHGSKFEVFAGLNSDNWQNVALIKLSGPALQI
jgi:hypothetical protein